MLELQTNNDDRSHSTDPKNKRVETILSLSKTLKTVHLTFLTHHNNDPKSQYTTVDVLK